MDGDAERLRLCKENFKKELVKELEPFLLPIVKLINKALTWIINKLSN